MPFIVSLRSGLSAKKQADLNIFGDLAGPIFPLNWPGRTFK
jgi:hypothetical protein